MDATVSDLHHYLRNAREAVLWKLDGLSEFDARRPMVSTATNLLGLVKHPRVSNCSTSGSRSDGSRPRCRCGSARRWHRTPTCGPRATRRDPRSLSHTDRRASTPTTRSPALPPTRSRTHPGWVPARCRCIAYWFTCWRRRNVTRATPISFANSSMEPSADNPATRRCSPAAWPTIALRSGGRSIEPRSNRPPGPPASVRPE